MAEWIFNLGEAAEYMFDHAIFQDNLVFVDFCEQMVKETNPGLLGQGRADRGPQRRASTATAPSRDIMRVVQPVHRRDVPRGAADQPPHPRDVLPDGGAARAPLDAVPGRHRHGGHAAGLHRLPGAPDQVHRLRQAPGAAERRRLQLLLRGPARLREGGQAARPARLLGRLPGSRRGRLPLRDHDRLGPGHVRHARASWSTASWSRPIWWRSTSASASCWATRSTTTGRARRPSSSKDPLGNPVDQRHPWNQTTIPKPQKRNLREGPTAG